MITGSKIRQADYPIEALLLDPWSPRVMSGEEISSMMKSQHLLKDDRKVVQTDFKGIAGRSASHFGRSTLDCRSKRFSNRKGNENMKTKLTAVALVASAVTIAQANPGGVPAARGTSHTGAVARSAPAVHAPMRPGGVSSFRSTPMRLHGSRPFYSGQRSPSFGMRSSSSSAYRGPSYWNRASFTRSGPYTVATIPQRNRVARFANRRNPAVTGAWNRRNSGTQFRNVSNPREGKEHLRRDWQKHIYAHR